MRRRRNRRKGRSDVMGGTALSSLSVIRFFFCGGCAPCRRTHFPIPGFVFRHIHFCAEEEARVTLVPWWFSCSVAAVPSLATHTGLSALLSRWGRCFTFFPEHSLHFLFFCCVYVICPYLFLKLAFPESPVSALQALIGWDLHCAHNVLDAAFFVTLLKKR